MQPQASKFYVLLAVPPGGDDIITQPAQVREIDQQVYKYVGVGGVDKPRIVQVGNAIVFGEQEILTNVYATQRADVSAVIEGILGQHMAVQATLVDYFVAAAEEAGWAAAEIDRRLKRIVDSTAIGEIRIVDPAGAPVYTSLPAPLTGGPGRRPGAGRRSGAALGQIGAGRGSSDGAAYTGRRRLQVRHGCERRLAADRAGRHSD